MQFPHVHAMTDEHTTHTVASLGASNASSGVLSEQSASAIDWRTKYANAFTKLARAIQKEKEVLAAEGKQNSPRLVHLHNLETHLAQGNVKPFIAQLAERANEVAHNINAKNFESAKTEIIERLKVILELTKDSKPPLTPP